MKMKIKKEKEKKKIKRSIILLHLCIINDYTIITYIDV